MYDHDVADWLSTCDLAHHAHVALMLSISNITLLPHTYTAHAILHTDPTLL